MWNYWDNKAIINAQTVIMRFQLSAITTGRADLSNNTVGYIKKES
jgi:hypothetical protein